MGLHIADEIVVGGITYDIEFEVSNVKIGNDGIGSYEFWGARGYDRGHDFVEEYDIGKLVVCDHGTGEEIKGLAKETRDAIASAIPMDEKLHERIEEAYWQARSEEVLAMIDEAADRRRDQ